MQHLDEGTIHSWLDGALSADEAARVEAHVAECRQCAAAVAEARGLIAASSRILTALDNIPRGVVPVVPAVRWSNRPALRAAAAVLVVAVGSLLVFRDGGTEGNIATSLSRSAPNAIETVTSTDSMRDETMRATPQPAPLPRAQGSALGRTSISSQPRARSPETGVARSAAADTVTATDQASALAYSHEARAPASQPSVPARESNALGEKKPAGTTQAAGRVGGVVAELSAASGYAAQAAAPTAQPFGQIRLRGASSMNAEPLKVVGTPRTLGAKVTLYEVAPGDTVTLTEVTQLRLEAVVVTSSGEARTVPPQQATGKTARARSNERADSAANAPATDSQRPAAGAAMATASALRAPAPVKVVGVEDGVTTISWRDVITGNELKLSGRLPAARLQQIKIRIELERAIAVPNKP